MGPGMVVGEDWSLRRVWTLWSKNIEGRPSRSIR